MINSENLQNILKSLERDVRCPRCGSSYMAENIELVGQWGNSFLIKLNCPSCGSPLLVNVVVSHNRVHDNNGHLDSVSELNENEKGLKQFKEEVSIDDVIDIASSIRKENESFSRLFGQE